MFSAFTKPNYPKSALGLEADRAVLLSLDKSRRGEFSIDRAAVAELPEGLLVPGFASRNIGDRSEMADMLRDVAARAGLLKERRWSVALPGNSARTSVLTLDSVPASKKELDEIIDWKAESSFGAPAASLRLSVEEISPDPEGKARYYASAISLDVLAEFEGLFSVLGWQAGLILPRAVSESSWLGRNFPSTDTLLISSNWDGFTALLLRGEEPLLVRSVSCAPGELDDEIYRLLLFYNDRLRSASAKPLSSVLVSGRAFDPERLRAVATESMGRDLSVLGPDDVGLSMPGGLSFEDLAAAGGIAALGLQ
jgi:hypothetical protein